MNEQELLEAVAALLEAGASDEEIEAFVAEHEAQPEPVQASPAAPAAPRPERPLTREQRTDARLRMLDDDVGPSLSPEHATGLLSSAAQGATLRLAGAAVPGVRRAAAAFHEQEPVAAIAGDIVGGSLPFAGVARVGGALIKRAAAWLANRNTKRIVAKSLARTGQEPGTEAIREGATLLEALGPGGRVAVGELGPLSNEMAGRAFAIGQEMIATGRNKELGQALIRASRRKTSGDLPVRIGRALAPAAIGGAAGGLQSGDVSGALLGTVLGGAAGRARGALARQQADATFSRLLRPPPRSRPPIDFVDELAKREAAKAPMPLLGRGPLITPPPGPRPAGPVPEWLRLERGAHRMGPIPERRLLRGETQPPTPLLESLAEREAAAATVLPETAARVQRGPTRAQLRFREERFDLPQVTPEPPQGVSIPPYSVLDDPSGSNLQLHLLESLARLKAGKAAGRLRKP